MSKVTIIEREDIHEHSQIKHYSYQNQWNDRLRDLYHGCNEWGIGLHCKLFFYVLCCFFFKFCVEYYRKNYFSLKLIRQGTHYSTVYMESISSFSFVIDKDPQEKYREDKR